MFGGGRRPPFGGFFGGDDFFGNDPFARDPFRQMDRMMEDFFGRGAMFGRQGGMFGDPFFHHEPFSGPDFTQREVECVAVNASSEPKVLDGFASSGAAPRALPQGTTVEEMDDEEHAHHGGGGRHQHHVQEPDDDAGHGNGGGGGHGGSGGEDNSVPVTHGNGGFGGGLGRLFGESRPGGASVYSCSSSSFGRMGGADGTSYNRTFTERVGPGGVRERQETVRDSRTGKESVTVTRHIGDRGRTSVRTRGPDGRVDTREQLHNLDPDSASQFDAEWLGHAERGLTTRSRSGGSGGGGRRIPIMGADDPPEQQQHTRIEEVGAGAGVPLQAARSNSGRRWI